MHVLFILARTYPFWAIPLCLVIWEIGMYYRRNVSPLQFIFWLLMLGVAFTCVIWVWFRGDLHSDEWVRLIYSFMWGDA